MEATFGDNANNIIYREAAVEFFFLIYYTTRLGSE